MIGGGPSRKGQLSADAPTRVIGCGLTPVQLARISDAVRLSASLATASSPLELYDQLRNAIEAVDLVIVGTRPVGATIDEVIRQLRALRPQLPIVAYLSSATEETATMPALAAAGVNEIVVPGYNDDRTALRAAVMAARRNCAAIWTLRKLAAVMPSELRPFAERVLANPSEITTVPQLARRAGVNRKTIFNWCRRTGFVRPGEMIAWCRLALVGYYLETTRCSVDTIARDLGYPSAATLRNTLQRHVHTTATQLRAQGGLGGVIAALARAVDEGRVG